MGEQDIQVFDSSSRVAVDTFAGRIHIEWGSQCSSDPYGAATFFYRVSKGERPV